MAFDTPILLLIFNRPEPLIQVIEALRPFAPSRLYVVADGPRAHKAGEAERCEATRQVIDVRVDWPCEIQRLYRPENLGCRRSVAGGITWFFEQVEAGIILEDDCLPGPDFLPFCAEMLQTYAHDERIFHLGGNCFIPQGQRPAGAYYAARLPLIWGWASWRRAWQQYCKDMEGWAEYRDSGQAFKLGLPPWFVSKYLGYFERVAQNGIDTWDYQWTYSIWRQGGLCLTPTANLVSNIGFGAGATHTTQAESRLANLPLEPLPSPWQPPAHLNHNAQAEAKALGFMHGRHLLERLWLKFKARFNL